MENRKFVLPKDVEPNNVQHETVSHLKNKIAVRIHSTSEKMNTTILLSPDEKVKDIFPLLALKYKGVNERTYDLKLAKVLKLFSIFQFSRMQEIMMSAYKQISH